MQYTKQKQQLTGRQAVDIILAVTSTVSVNAVNLQSLVRFLRADSVEGEISWGVADNTTPTEHQLYCVLL